MLTLLFDGWFQCRLPTNPDPSDEPRGVSGYSFAVAGEPDLDRIIRFNDPIAHRSHGPPVGVAVRTVLVDDQVQPASHALIGSRVDLLDEPKFEAANGILAKEGWQPILPFHLQVSSQDGREILSAQMSEKSAPVQFIGRKGVNQATVVAVSQLFASQAGVTDPVAYRLRRRALLEADLRTAEEDDARCALEKRIRELKIPEHGDPYDQLFKERRLLFMNALEIRSLELNGRSGADAHALLGHALNEGMTWAVEIWMGAWDADALCGFVKGVLKVPLLRQTQG